MKKLLLCMVLAGMGLIVSARALGGTASGPQVGDTVVVASQGTLDPKADSLQRELDKLSRQVDLAEWEARQRSIWKDRAKYFNIGYVWQALTLTEMHDQKWKSDFGVNISTGKTYYLHRNPIARMMKFGIDWTYFDVNYAKYSDSETGGGLEEDFSLGLHQADIAMQVGPSFTINPVGDLKVSLYFRYVPTFSLVVLDSEIGYNYASFFNAGLAVSWKVISIGFENRWGNAKYNNLTVSEDDVFDGGVTGDLGVDDLFTSFSRKLKTNSMRFYISFRF